MIRTRSGHRRSLPEVRFENFPDDDGLWWLRWFDYESHGGGATSSSMLRVTFSQLPTNFSEDALPVLDVSLAVSRARQQSAFVQSGWLPVLSIGLVVRSGRIVGQLGSVIRSFAFTRTIHRSYIEDLVSSPLRPPVRAGAPGSPMSPAAPLRKLPPRKMPHLLSSIAYPLKGVESGHLLSIRSSRPDTEHLVLPCPEVFRVTYAPHRVLALALLGGPWAVAVRRVLDPDASEAVAGDATTDAYWRLAPARELGTAHAAVAANLWLNDVGRKAAESIRRSIYEPVGRTAAIEADFPFEWITLELEVACIPLRPREPSLNPTWLGYAITALRWPDPPQGPPPRITWIPTRTVPEPGGEPDEPVGQPGYKRVVAVPDDEASVLEADQGSDASDGPSVDIESDGPRWWNIPEVVRAEPRFAGRGDGRRLISVATPTSKLSAGAGSGRQTDAAMAQAQALDPFGGGDIPADRFSRVIAMLDDLAGNGSILSHAEVTPPRGQAANRGPLAVWAFPETPVVTSGGVERWYMRSFRSRYPLCADVRRTAMVRSIIVDGSIVYWMETEPRSSRDHHHSLVFSHGTALHLSAVISKLLELAAGRQGVWPEPTELSNLLPDKSIGFAALWRHRSRKMVVTDAAEAGKPTPTSLFSYAGALAAIRRAAFG